MIIHMLKIHYGGIETDIRFLKLIWPTSKYSGR